MLHLILIFILHDACTGLLSQLKDAVIHGTASDIEFTTLEALKLIVLESLGAEQVRLIFESYFSPR